MTDRSYQASAGGQICLDLHLFVPSLVLHGSMYLSLLSDPSVLISTTDKPWTSHKMGHSTTLTWRLQSPVITQILICILILASILLSITIWNHTNISSHTQSFNVILNFYAVMNNNHSRHQAVCISCLLCLWSLLVGTDHLLGDR
jgi:hypothetical protein